MGSHSRQRSLVLLALFLSGLAGLMHEVVWAKLLANLTGSTAKAHAVVLSVFMGGLAIGAVLFGKRSDKRERPLMVYVVLEAAIGVYCLLLPTITRVAGSLYESLAAQTFESPGTKTVLRLGLSLAVITLPAVLMGGTLPVLARYLIEEVAQTRKAVASLYALNNIGAVLGSGVAGFYLLPEYGIYGSLIAASSMNFVAAGIVWLANKRTEPASEPTAAEAAAAHAALPVYTSSQFQVTLWALALSGFAAMGYEVVFLRIIALGFGSSTYSFTVMLMCFITGIGIGSGIVSLAKVERPMWWLAASQMGVIVSLIAVTPLIEHMPYLISSMRTHLIEWPADLNVKDPVGPVPGGFAWFLTGQAGYCFLMLLAPTICIGMGFPLVSQIQARSVSNIGSTVGSTYAWNTVGNVLGVVVTSLVLTPQLGMENALHANLALNFVAVLLLVFAATETAVSLRVASFGAMAAIAALYGFAGRDWSRVLKQGEGHLRLRRPPPADADALFKSRYPATSYAAWKKKYVRDPAPKAENWQDFMLEEDADTALMGVRRERLAAIYINSKGDASTGPLDMITFLLSGHIPMFFLPDAKDVMVIGHGSGVSAGGIAQHAGVERIDVVEISEAVIQADRLFEESNHHVLSDPRTHVYLDDARTFLRTVPRKYDLIMSQPSNPWIAGIGSLFTDDFFRDCRDRLKPGGIAMVWFHHYEQSDETIQLIVRTINSVFPNVQVFLTVESDVMALCSMEPLRIDFARMEQRFDEPAVRQDLARVGVYNVATLLTYHGMTPAHFAALSGEGPLNTDDHQRLEYKGARNMFLGSNATLLAKDTGFDALPDGSTDWLLDRYIAWRREQGDPVNRIELVVALASVQNMLMEGHRLTKGLSARLEPMPRELVDLSKRRAARGGQVPIDQMGFSEAFNWGIMLHRFRGPDIALPYYERAAKLEPSNTMASMALSAAYSELKREGEALDEIRRIIGVAFDPAPPMLALAKRYVDAGERDEARELLDELIATQDHGSALMQVGGLLAEGGRKELNLAMLAAGDGDAAGATQHREAAKQLFEEAKSYSRRAIVRDVRPQWEATMNLSALLRLEAADAALAPDQRKRLLEEALSEVKYAQYHHPGVTELQGEFATLSAALAQNMAGPPVPEPAR